LEDTLQEMGLLQSGREDWVEIVSLVDTPALRWLLRDFSDVTYVSLLQPDFLPSVILMPGDGPDLSQTMTYRGQDFVWQTSPAWSGPLPPQVWSWITTRQAPVKQERLILWARSDLFPEEISGTEAGSTTQPLEDEIPPQEEGSSE
jgi:hypothetical protein